MEVGELRGPGIALMLLLSALAGCTTPPEPLGTAEADAGETRAQSPEAPVPLRIAGPAALEALVEAWGAALPKAANARVHYEATYPAAALRAVAEGRADLALVSGPAAPEPFGDLVAVPALPEAVALVYNLPGIADLRLSPAVLSGVYRGTITRWDDEAVAALNPDLDLPAAGIIPVHRNDPSGETLLLSAALANADPAWADLPGWGERIPWPAGLPAVGDNGVAEVVLRNEHALGYVHAAYAAEHGLESALLENDAGNLAAPLAGAGVVAAEVAPLLGTGPGAVGGGSEAAYPLASVAAFVAPRDAAGLAGDPARARAAATFVDFAVHEGQRVAQERQLPRLPAEAISAAETALAELQFDRQPLLEALDRGMASTIGDGPVLGGGPPGRTRTERNPGNTTDGASGHTGGTSSAAPGSGGGSTGDDSGRNGTGSAGGTSGGRAGSGATGGSGAANGVTISVAAEPALATFVKTLAPAAKSATGHTLSVRPLETAAAAVRAGQYPLAFTTTPVEPPAEGRLLHFPIALRGVALAHSIEGVTELRLSGPALADIYLGRVTAWDDPTIAALNEGITLPNAAIVVVTRSDTGPLNELFTGYLAAVSEAWKAERGVTRSPDWPLGIAARSDEEVAGILQGNPMALAFLDAGSKALEGLEKVALKNKDGQFPTAGPASLEAAGAGAAAAMPQAHEPWANVSALDERGPSTWPITGFIYAIAPQDLPTSISAAQAEGLLDVLTWSLDEAGPAVASAGQFAAPVPVTARVQPALPLLARDGASVATGQPVLFGSTSEGSSGRATVWEPPDLSGTSPVRGAGATFPEPLLSHWTDRFEPTGATISYTGTGSGFGLNQMIEKTLDFGASDAPVAAADMHLVPDILHIPETLGGVAIIYHLPGVPELRLTGPVVASIYLGDITAWDDPAIAALNPGVALPPNTIAPVFRSDGSGTTYVFTDYLATVSPAWADQVGRTLQGLEFPAGTGAQYNDGVASAVQTQPYAIGYVEDRFGKVNNLYTAKIRNKAGEFIAPGPAGVAKAAAQAGNILPEGSGVWEGVTLVDQAGSGTYPIASFTYLLVYRDLSKAYGPQMDLGKAKALVSFLWWIIHQGQQDAPALHYAQLPSHAVANAEATIRSITYGNAAVTETLGVPP